LGSVVLGEAADAMVGLCLCESTVL
jgi:hypothetical protein